MLAVRATRCAIHQAPGRRRTTSMGTLSLTSPVAGAWRSRRGGSASGRAEDAELVTFRVSQNLPREVAPACVGGRRAEGLEPGHLRRLTVTVKGVGRQVEMDTVPHVLQVGRAEELQIRADTL